MSDLDDRGIAALADLLRAVDPDGCSDGGRGSFFENWSAVILGERGVFLPDGLPAESRLRAALKAIVDAMLIAAPGGFYCPYCGTNVNVHGTTCPVFIASAALAATPEPDGLDAAWKEAEAALPEGWVLAQLVRRQTVGRFAPEPERLWKATAQHGPRSDAEPWFGASGPTPAAALHALDARLSKEPTE